MKRYFRLYLYFLRFSFSKAMHFRVDFFFRVIMDCTFYLLQFSFFEFLFYYTDVLGDWDLHQVRIFIAGYIMVDALHMTFFSNNMWLFPLSINRGELDYYLTKPVSPLFMMSTKEFAANSFLNLLMTIVIMFWAITSYPGNLSPDRIILFLILILNGTYLFYLLHLLFLLPVFWTQSNRGFADLFFTAQKVSERPHQIFSSKLRLIFLTIIPFGIIASLPTTILFSESILDPLLWCLSVTIIFQILVLVVWNKGLAVYSSASS